MEEWQRQFGVCFTEAKQFTKVANSVDQFNIDKMLNGGMYSFAVNISFACELFLKAIKIYETKGCNYKPTHNLCKLYNDISKQAKEKIKEEFEKENDHNIYKFLKKESNNFLAWRYAFERCAEINVSLFTIFSEILEKYVDELRGKING